MEKKIREIIAQHVGGTYEAKQKCAEEILRLFRGGNGWIYVNEETPPNYLDILAKAPDGTIHLTSWRPDYNIFCCQGKRESTFDWQWKRV